MFIKDLVMWRHYSVILENSDITKHPWQRLVISDNLNLLSAYMIWNILVLNIKGKVNKIAIMSIYSSPPLIRPLPSKAAPLIRPLPACRVNLVTNPVIRHEWGKDWEVFTTSGTYPWSFVTQIFHNGQPSRGDDRKAFEVMTST